MSDNKININREVALYLRAIEALFDGPHYVSIVVRPAAEGLQEALVMSNDPDRQTAADIMSQLHDADSHTVRTTDG